MADAREAAELLGLGDGIRPRATAPGSDDDETEPAVAPPLVIGGDAGSGRDAGRSLAVAAAPRAAVASPGATGDATRGADGDAELSAGERLISKLGGRDSVLEQADAIYQAIRG